MEFYDCLLLNMSHVNHFDRIHWLIQISYVVLCPASVFSDALPYACSSFEASKFYTLSSIKKIPMICFTMFSTKSNSEWDNF